MRVCVIGASGHLGEAVVEELCRRKISVVAVARKTSSKVERIRELGAAVEFVDASDPDDSITTSLTDVTTFISCLAAHYENVDETSDFWAIDRDANIRFGRQALQAGVKHLILVATFEGPESRTQSEFSNAKEQAVDVLRAECKQYGDAKLTVLRPNAFFKDLTDRVFDRVLTTNRYTVRGEGKRRINPIAREDVAVFIADCVDKKHPPGNDYPLGGPDIFTFREMGMLASRIIGNDEQFTISRNPVWTLRGKAACFSLFGHWSRPARRQAAFLRWIIHCSTHDLVAPCVGRYRLCDEYRRKYQLFQEQHHTTSNELKEKRLAGRIAVPVYIMLTAAAVGIFFYRRQN